MNKRSVYLFFLILLSVQIAAAQTMPSGGFALDGGFGGSSAVADGQAFVGSSPVGWPTGDKPAGTVHVYEQDGSGDWVEVQSIGASDGRLGDHFGRSVYAGGGMLIVGAPGNEAAYVFKKGADGTWAEAGKLSPSVADGYEFGGAYARGGMRSNTIAVSGQRILVTSYNSTTNTGAVHVFHAQDTGWTEKAIFDSGNEGGGDGFGWSIAANKNAFFVGATMQNARKGAVHVFRMSTSSGTWERSGILAPDMLTAGAAFGTSVALHNQHVLAGAPRLNNTGGVVAFEMGRDGSSKFLAVLQEEEPADGSRKSGGFGSAVVVDGNNMLIGARGAVFTGAVRLGPVSLNKITAPDTRSGNGFGMTVAADGGVLTIGSPSADYEEGVSNIYELNSSDGTWNHAGLLAADIARLASMYGAQVDCEDGQAGMFACEDVDMVSFMSLTELTPDRGVKMTDIWGWEDPETGKEWVLQARTEGVSFVDISNPSYPVYVGQLMKTATSPGSAWRDVKVYKDHAFVVADGAEAHGVQIFDLRQLRDVDPEDMPVTFEETAHYDGVNSTHNIVINEETGFAYAVGNRSGGETCGGQLHMIDVNDPANPTFAGCYSLAEAGGTHDSQCVVYRGADTNFAGREVCFTSNGSSFIIADVTDKDSPETLAHTSYPNQAYTHQGWLSEDQSYFYMNDELDEMTGIVEQTRTLIWDVRELGDPTLVGEFLLDSKASDHNLYIRGNLMYQSNYQAGLRILDISDPEHPIEVGHFDTTPGGEDKAGFGGSWSNYPYFKSGIIAVSSRGEGLFLLKKRSVDI